MKQWRHVFKLDPAKHISDKQLEKLCKSGTDAVIIGGTDHITLEGVLDLLIRIRQFSLPRVLEISTVRAISPGFDYYFIPMVMNSHEKKWMMDVHHEVIKQCKDFINWDETFIEGYCILNEDSKAYQKTNCKLPSEDDVIAYAHMAEHIFSMPIFYIEYSGTYGDPELVRRVSEELSETLLFYGGGIQTKEQAREMINYADTIVVGNSIYTNFEQALETVQAVK